MSGNEVDEGGEVVIRRWTSEGDSLMDEYEQCVMTSQGANYSAF